MPRRRGSTRGGSIASATRRGTSGRIQKNSRTRQAPQRYGQIPESEPGQPPSEDSLTLERESEEADASEYSNPPTHNSPRTDIQHHTSSSISIEPETLAPYHQPSIALTESSVANDGITLNDMRNLLQSHEDDIINRVVLRLQAVNPPTSPMRHQPPVDPSLLRITELENELSQLRAQREPRVLQGHAALEPGTYNPTQPPPARVIESASGIAESVESMFPGVERNTLTQIIENRYKPTNIYRLLATVRERAELQRTISIGGVEFEQAERDGKESEYRMSSFFMAWVAYCGIIVKLALYGLQGELATSLFIHTMNLYDLLKKYTWEGVKAYNFQFHWKRVASGKNIYLPNEWHQLDSKLIASKCFTYPLVRNTLS